VIFGAIAAFWLLSTRKEIPDELLRRALANIPTIQAYTQHVTTETDIAGRVLHVAGIYHIDRAHNRFSSSATTTLTIPDGSEPQIFNLANVSIGEDVYVKVETADESLRSRIPHSPEWKHFNRIQIPDALKDIAIAGPILDNLLLFSEGGMYLDLVDNRGKEDFQGENLARYSFTLGGTPKDIGGTLQTLMGRIENGSVDIWVDPDSAQIRHMVIARAEYHSTTTFENINHIPDIAAPASSSD
jgi:hypothetical protein